jgi:outer membrane protein insertion porin family/translocation and assembly module TamA
MLASLTAALALAASDPSCEPGAPEVRAVRFEGHRALRAAALDSAIATHASARARRWLHVVGTRRCLAEGEAVRDQVRLLLLYRRRGWTRATVTPHVEPAGDDAVRLRFRIVEGAPLAVDTIVLAGVPDSVEARVRGALGLRAGEPVDRDRVGGAAERLELALRELGMLRARVDTSVGPAHDSAGAPRAAVTFAVSAGPVVRVGAVRVAAEAPPGERRRVSDDEARRIAGLPPGTRLRESELRAARRRLADAGIFQQVVVRPVFPDADLAPETDAGTVRPAALHAGSPRPAAERGDSLVDVEVRLVEGLRHAARAEAGWATFDCGRASAQLDRAGTFRPAGHLTLEGRVSKLFVGAPLDVAPGLCQTPVRADPYSQRLNFRLGATYRHPALGPRGAARSVTLFTERRGEYLAYERATYVGAAGRLARGVLGDQGRAWTATLGYDLSFGRTLAEPAVLCGVFNACLGAERARLQQARPFGVASVALARTTTDDVTDPTRGVALRAELRGATRWLGSNAREQFAGVRVEGAAYRRLARGVVLAARVQGGELAATRGGYVPQQERLFAGGPNSVRGYRPNLVGPRLYQPDSVRVVEEGGQRFLWAVPDAGTRAVPTGGTAQLVGNLELRLRPRGGPALVRDLAQLVAFVDAGSVWDRGAPDVESRDYRVHATPGLGVRAFTPVGPLRLDVGYNPAAGRRGAAYRGLDGGAVGGQPLYCVSPGNRLPLTTGGAGLPVQASGPCPATFVPPRPGSFAERLTLHFSLGQAF